MSSSSTALSSRDAKVTTLLSGVLQKLTDFRGEVAAEAAAYAAAVVVSSRLQCSSDEDFRDHIMAIIANVKNLDGELMNGSIVALPPETLAAMDVNEMRSKGQKKSMAVMYRKRAREQTNIDNTSLHCKKCNLVRRDRLNINELALDSEENGSHFDYNFDNVCTCSHSSEEHSSSGESGGDDDDSDKEEALRSSRSSGSDDA